jgi:DnaK suppressor protein
MAQQIDLLKAALQNKRFEIAHWIRSQRPQLNACEGEHELMDQLQSMTRRDEAVTLLDSLTRTLAAVDAALLAMRDDSYGICAECSEPIPPKRLIAIPWALRCIRCEEMLDHRDYLCAADQYWDEAA